MAKVKKVQIPVELQPMIMKQQAGPGYKTTEFWITLFVMLTNTLLASGLLGSTIEPHVAAIVNALVAAGYGVSRGIAKKG